jgi:transcription initiation factor TFIIIB Brf1 subunit/transcription initiation factor TFIIB
MMKVFICPECGWMRVVSRRKDVECFKCGEPKMNLAKIDFENYATMTEEERKDYADGWLYIHQKAKRET